MAVFFSSITYVSVTMDIETFLSFSRLRKQSVVEHAKRVYVETSKDLLEVCLFYRELPPRGYQKAKRQAMHEINKLVMSLATLLDDMNCTPAAQAQQLGQWADLLHNVHLPHLRS
jgi:acetyl-CoA carboxylase alpha subunit